MGSRETVVNIIAQLPVSNNMAELPGLDLGPALQFCGCAVFYNNQFEMYLYRRDI